MSLEVDRARLRVEYCLRIQAIRQTAYDRLRKLNAHDQAASAAEVEEGYAALLAAKLDADLAALDLAAAESTQAH